MNDDIPTLRRILAEYRVVAMVGLSASWYRPSYFAAKYLIDHGYRVIPVNPRYEEVLGQRCYPTLKDIPEPVDVVDCFRPARDIAPLARDAVDIGAKVLWMQLGILNEEAAEIARKAGMEVIADRCMKSSTRGCSAAWGGRRGHQGHLRKALDVRHPLRHGTRPRSRNRRQRSCMPVSSSPVRPRTRPDSRAVTHGQERIRPRTLS